MKLINVGFEGFKTGISVPEDCDLIVEQADFKNVQTCYEIRKVAKKTSEPNKKVKKDNGLNVDINQVIQNLHNLEIQSKMNKDFEQLEKIRKLKGLIGSKKFICEYFNLVGEKVK
ncbi:hypothetical protein [Acinetobacter pittii]|uniref:hypothetical protein n=1 Tax=Acinetobacter pittii TaxID=48296 RepID=UPI0039782547